MLSDAVLSAKGSDAEVVFVVRSSSLRKEAVAAPGSDMEQNAKA